MPLGISFPSAQANVKKLVSDKTLVEVTGKHRNRVYLAPAIIEIIKKDDRED